MAARASKEERSVAIFGSLTFFLQDDTFVNPKVTILYALFGSAPLGARWFDKLLFPAVFDSAFHLDDRRKCSAFCR